MSDMAGKEVTRRGFITRVGQGLLAANLTGSLLKNASAQLTVPDPPGKKLGWAIVGLGSLSIHQILPAFAKCEKSKVVAFVSGHPDKANKLALRYGVSSKNIYNYENYDSIKDNPEIDVIYIVLPNGMHAEYTVRGLQAGKHVLGEKPMANTPAECQQMIDAAKKADRKLMVAYRCRYETYNREAIRIARSGELGPTQMILADTGFAIDDPATWYSGLRMWIERGNTIEEKELPVVDHFASEMDHMSDCVMQNKQPLTPGEEGLRDITLIHAVYESARTGKTVKV